MLEIAHTYKTNSLSIPEVIPIKQLGINRALFLVPDRPVSPFVIWYYDQYEEYLSLYSGQYYKDLDHVLLFLQDEI